MKHPMKEQMIDQIRQIIRRHARLPLDPSELLVDGDLYEAGMSSHASIDVMLALEDDFDIEFPDRMLTRDVFASIATIAAAVKELQVEAAA